ncbi:hypothetical protein DCC79_13785, partial [bacterium]
MLVLASLTWLGMSATAGARGERPSIMRQAQGAHVVVAEVQYDPAPGGSESRYEWVELFNPGDAPVGIAGWRIADNQGSDALPDAVLPPGGFLVVAAGDGFAELFPDFAGAVVHLGGSIGNGLGNSGDQVRLLGPDGAAIDAMSYGDDNGVLDPSAPDVGPGHSLERVPAGTDTDSAADWQEAVAPSPGFAGGAPRPTATAAPPGPPTVAPGVTVRLNEYLAAPSAVDWDGDGTATRDDEWVELFNAGDAMVDIGGWQLDDSAGGGSAPFVVPGGTVIGPRGHLALYKRQTGLALNNDADTVRLLRPDGTEADAHAYAGTRPDVSHARLSDGDGAWADTLAPSPGAANRGPDAPSTPPGAPSPTPLTGGTPGPATPPVPARPAFLPLLISEVLFDPAASGDDAAGEWVELFNRSDAAVDLAGWSIGDRVRWDILPAAAVPPWGFVIVAAGAAMGDELRAAGATVVVVADGAIGNGLANRGDVVRLRGPTGEAIDAVSYGDNLDAFDPAVPRGPPGTSVERLPPDTDTDTASDWWLQPAPSPGRAGLRHDAPPRVVLNEVLPAPSRVDWDGDGAPGFADEWVELYNAADHPVDLEGWRLEDRAADGWSHRFPPGTRVSAGGFHVVFRAASGLALDNGADTVRLIRSDGVEADRFTWTAPVGYDRSWSRAGDGADAWTGDYAVTPGAPNRPRAAASGRAHPPTSDEAEGAARPIDLTDVRRLAPGSRVAVAGRVTLPPGVIDARTAYIGTEAAGVRLFLAPKGASLPPWAEGDRVSAVGRLKDYHGEREVVLAGPGDVRLDGPGPAVEPLEVPTGTLDEALEGRLVALGGRVVSARATRWSLDDGSGPAVVALPRGGGRPWPAAAPGAWWSAIGVVGQYAARAPWEGGHRLTPRQPADVRPRAAAAGG